MLGCPGCGRKFRTAADLTNICDGCGLPVDRSKSRLLKLHSRTVLICEACEGQLAYRTLDDIVNGLTPAPFANTSDTKSTDTAPLTTTEESSDELPNQL